jgi:hypothetical protein
MRVVTLAGLERRLYIPEHLHPGMRFDIYTDGLVIMYVFGVETARKKLRRTFDHDVYTGFAEELAAYGIGIAPMGEIGEMKKTVEEVSEKVETLEKEVKRLKRRK